METKICKKCGKELSINDFYVHKQMNDGHLNFCKECVRTRVHKHREDNIERIREYDRNRPNAKERGIKQRLRLKEDEIKKQKYNEQKSKWGNLNRYKRNAHTKLKRAIEKGSIVKPNKCGICGKTNCEIQGHHYDYSKPLDVIWLCTECHGKVHRKYNKIELLI